MKQTKTLLIPCAMLLIAGCAATIPEEEKQTLAKPVDCTTASQDIAALEQQKATPGEEALSAARTVLPAAAVVGAARGELKDRASVASGDYNREIEAKIALIKTTCGLQ